MLVEMSACRSGDQRLELLFDQSPGFMAVLEGQDHTLALANDAFVDLVGTHAQIGTSLASALPPPTRQDVERIFQEVTRTGRPYSVNRMAFSVERADASVDELIVNLVVQPLASADGQPPGIFVHGKDVTADRHEDDLRTAHNRILELAFADAPLERTLTELIRMVESASRTGVLGSILLLDPDGKHLRLGAAPSLPLQYSAILDGAEIGDCRGSCGTAAYLGAAVFVSDIASDPLWADFKHLPLAHGLRACWSIPILTRERKVLGTFAMYHGEPREPTARDLMLVDLVTQTAALVIDREQAKSALEHLTSADCGPTEHRAMAREA